MDGVLVLLLVGYGAVALLLAVAWVVMITRRAVGRARLRLMAASRPRGGGQRDTSQEWLYRERPPAETSREPELGRSGEKPQPERLREAAVAAEQKGEQIREARREAEAIVRDAEQKASEILADAERRRALLEEELARERALIGQSRSNLSSFLAAALEEVKRVSSQGPAEVHDVGPAEVHDMQKARELREGSGAPE